MKRATLIFILFSFFPLALLPGDVSGTSPCSNSLTPPFITSGVKPNILIILDNSQSFDEDFLGNAVGSYSPVSKSVVARQQLQTVVTNLEGKANVGIMTFSLPSDVGNNWYVHNAMPFASYNPNSYCPNATQATIQACVNYCTNMDSADKAACDAGCPPNTSLGQTFTSFTGQLFTHNDGTKTNFTDLLITSYAAGNSTRARYCGLTYPKTQMWQYNDPLGFTTTVYYNQTDPFYDTTDDGTLFGYSGKDSPTGSAYSTAENAANTYTYCPDKMGTSDSFVGYSGPSGGTSTTGCKNYQFIPTDSDWALGFYNWGQSMPWYYVGPTWFSNSQASGSPQGYLHVAIGDLTNSTQYNNVYNILNPNLNNSAGYMSCTASNKNTCPYIINASNTPTAGALQTALNYFNGTLKQGTTTYASPITSSCQRNFIILVTDGLPSTMLDGTQPIVTTQYCYSSSGTATSPNNPQTCTTTSSCPAGYNAYCTTSVMGQVLNQLSQLQTGVQQTFSGTQLTFPVNTYALGIGSEANGNLNEMAVAGNTATSSGQAYYASNPEQFSDALTAIISDLLGGVSSGSAISILAQGQNQNDANMLQAVFYPSKPFGETALTWPGYLYNYWFYNGFNTSSGSSNGQPVSNMREDTQHDFILELGDDYGITFSFTPSTGLQVLRASDPNGTGTPSVPQSTVTLDGMTPLWEAGKMLFQTSPGSRQIFTPNSNGTALVAFNTSNTTLTSLTNSPLGNPSTASNFDPCLQPPGTTGAGILDNLINYVQGTDITNYFCSNGTSFNSTPCTPGGNQCTTGTYTTCATLSSCRSRTVGLCSNGTAFNNTPCNVNSDCTTGAYTTCTKNVWKLGDIIYSTPQVWADYSYCYNGTSFNTTLCNRNNGNSDCVNSGAYNVCQPQQSLVFVGANDGMLHAFQTGTLTNSGLNPAPPAAQVEELSGIPTSSMGQELWAFIPQNSLPYLRCLAAPPPNGCHLYYNDLSPYITTMNEDYCSNDTTKSCGADSDCGSPGTCTKNPRTVLIGGMRLGGGSVTGPAAKYCFNSSGVTNLGTCTTTSSCNSSYNSSCTTAYPTNVPADTCSGGVVACSDPTTCYNPTKCTGLSSYYALDITNPQSPVLLWEFSHPFLGYTYSGPAVIHKWLKPATLGGDQYYVMFLSGPTSGTDGSSIQDVQAFVLTLNPTNLTMSSSVYYKDLGATTKNGFGGRLFTNGLDVNADGFTDFVFFGYANSDNGTSTDWTGGLAKVNTNNTNLTDALNPADWTWDITTYANIAKLPITATVAPMQCYNNWYLYAGTGRYFSSQDSYGFTSSGTTSPNYLMAIPFTCDQYNNNCTTISSLNSLTPGVASSTVCSNLQQGASALAQDGWEIALDTAGQDAGFLAERLITDPVTDPGTSQNILNQIYFITTEPTNDPCGYGGQSRVWGMNCATGGAITGQCPSGDANSYAIPATSNLLVQTSTGAITKVTAGDFGQEGNRATNWIVGIPPENSPPVGQGATTPNQPGQLIQWIEK